MIETPQGLENVEEICGDARARRPLRRPLRPAPSPSAAPSPTDPAVDDEFDAALERILRPRPRPPASPPASTRPAGRSPPSGSARATPSPPSPPTSSTSSRPPTAHLKAARGGVVSARRRVRRRRLPDRRRPARARRRRPHGIPAHARRCSATPPTSPGCPNGDLGCVWFGGTQEGVSDISIWFSAVCRPAADTWLPPVQLSDDPTRSEQNPSCSPRPTATSGCSTPRRSPATRTPPRSAAASPRDGGTTWGRRRCCSRRTSAGGVFVRQPPVVLASRPHPAARLPLRHHARREVGRQRGHVERVMDRRRRRHAGPRRPVPGRSAACT